MISYVMKDWRKNLASLKVFLQAVWYRKRIMLKKRGNRQIKMWEAKNFGEKKLSDNMRFGYCFKLNRLEMHLN